MNHRLPTVEADLGPGVRAFFTTRAGGTSTGEHSALNLGATVADEPRLVHANRALLDRAAGAVVAFAEQVHGADVHIVGGTPRAGSQTVATGDGLVTAAANVALGVVVADCVPVLLADPERGVVATAHAGRRGLVAGVVPAVLATMARLGADRIRAVVGPAICGACYEVPAAMRDEVDRLVPGAASTTSWGTPALDLPGAVVAQLHAGGVPDVARVAACTFTDDRFYSHRRWSADGTRRGRFAGVVRTL